MNSTSGSCDEERCMVPHLGVSGEGSPAVDAAACSDPLALCTRESLATVDIALRTAMKSSVHLDDVLKYVALVEDFVASDMETLEFPREDSNKRRMLMHKVAQHYVLQTGPGEDNSCVIARRTWFTSMPQYKLSELLIVSPPPTAAPSAEASSCAACGHQGPHTPAISAGCAPHGATTPSGASSSTRDSEHSNPGGATIITSGCGSSAADGSASSSYSGLLQHTAPPTAGPSLNPASDVSPGRSAAIAAAVSASEQDPGTSASRLVTAQMQSVPLTSQQALRPLQPQPQEPPQQQQQPPQRQQQRQQLMQRLSQLQQQQQQQQQQQPQQQQRSHAGGCTSSRSGNSSSAFSDSGGSGAASAAGRTPSAAAAAAAVRRTMPPARSLPPWSRPMAAGVPLTPGYPAAYYPQPLLALPAGYPSLAYVAFPGAPVPYPIMFPGYPGGFVYFPAPHILFAAPPAAAAHMQHQRP